MKTNGELYVRTKQTAYTVRSPVNQLELKKNLHTFFLTRKLFSVLKY